MTEIGFHYNAPDKLGYACRLVRKAVKVRGLRVVVIAEASMLDAMDSALWQLSAVDFIAHCRNDSEGHVVARSPVILSTGDPAGLAHRDMLLNLGSEVPLGFERFERLVDVVGDETEDRQRGRARWRHYADRGYAIKPHDFARSAA